jgi:hypothetical protein
MTAGQDQQDHHSSITHDERSWSGLSAEQNFDLLVIEKLNTITSIKVTLWQKYFLIIFIYPKW